MRYILLSVMCLWCLQLDAKEIILVGDAYCPYYCADETSPGFGLQLLYEIFVPLGYRVSYRRYPWLRAIRIAQQKNDSLRTYVTFGIQGERGFYQSTKEIDSLDVCFFTRHDSLWTWQGSNSKGVRLGVTKGSDYWFVKDFIDRNKMVTTYTASEYSAELLTKLLVGGRVDAVMEAAPVLLQYARKSQLMGSLRLAGCVDQELKFFLSLSKTLPGGPELLRQFDSGKERLEKSGRLAVLRQEYGIDNWPSLLRLAIPESKF